MDVEVLEGLDVALNESDFCDCRINERTGEVRLLFVVLSLPEDGPEERDRRHVVTLTGVSRIAASLRRGSPPGELVPLRLEDLPRTVRSFGCQPVYGWSFFDAADGLDDPGFTGRTSWRTNPSIDFTVGQGRGTHSLDLFQDSSPAEGETRRLDLRIEFDDLSVMDARGRNVPIDEFIAGGRRWWAALRAGDERVQGHGISLAGAAGAAGGTDAADAADAADQRNDPSSDAAGDP